MASIKWDSNNSGGFNLTNNNLTAISPNTGSQQDPIFVCFGSAPIPTGAKVYYEIATTGAKLLTAFVIGLANTYNLPNHTSGAQFNGTVGQPPPNPSTFITFSYNGTVQEETVYLEQFDRVNRPNPVFWTDPDVVGIAVDRIANTVTFSLTDSIANGFSNTSTTTQQLGGPWTSPPFDISRITGDVYPIVSTWFTPRPTATINGGSNGAFAMAVPSGYTPLDTYLTTGSNSGSGGPTGGGTSTAAPAGYTITVPAIANQTANVAFTVDVAFTYAANINTLQWSNESNGLINFRPVSQTFGGTSTLSPDGHTLTLRLLSGNLAPHTLIVIDTQYQPNLQSNGSTFNVVAPGGTTGGGGTPAPTSTFATTVTNGSNQVFVSVLATGFTPVIANMVYSIDGGTFVALPSNAAFPLNGTGNTVTFTLPTTGLSVGNHSLVVKNSDNSVIAPAVTFAVVSTTPAPGGYAIVLPTAIPQQTINQTFNVQVGFNYTPILANLQFSHTLTTTPSWVPVSGDAFGTPTLVGNLLTLPLASAVQQTHYFQVQDVTYLPPLQSPQLSYATGTTGGGGTVTLPSATAEVLTLAVTLSTGFVGGTGTATITSTVPETISNLGYSSDNINYTALPTNAVLSNAGKTIVFTFPNTAAGSFSMWVKNLVTGITSSPATYTVSTSGTGTRTITIAQPASQVAGVAFQVTANFNYVPVLANLTFNDIDSSAGNFKPMSSALRSVFDATGTILTMTLNYTNANNAQTLIIKDTVNSVTSNTVSYPILTAAPAAFDLYTLKMMNDTEVIKVPHGTAPVTFTGPVSS